MATIISDYSDAHSQRRISTALSAAADVMPASTTDRAVGQGATF
jgi:hypothetical protein